MVCIEMRKAVSENLSCVIAGMNYVAEIPFAGFGKLVGFVDERIDRYIASHYGFAIAGRLNGLSED